MYEGKERQSTFILDAESLRFIKNRNKHKSHASEKTVGAYLGLANLYPESVGMLGPTCTPRREGVAFRVFKEESERGMVQRP